MSRISRVTRGILAGTSASAFLIAISLVALSVPPAGAQTSDSVSAKCRTALPPHGTGRTANRWGEVSFPARVARWPQYTIGVWVHSDDYDRHWVSDSGEADGYDPNYRPADLNAD